MTLAVRKATTTRGRPLPVAQQHELNSRQAKIEGFHLPSYQDAHVTLIGAGGIGSLVGTSLIRKGLGHLTILDDDVVELSNLTRQLYSPNDIGKFKALRLASRLAAEALFPAQLSAYPLRFQELPNEGRDLTCNLIVCGVDNNPTRRAVSVYGLQHRIPVIHAAVSRDGNALYVMLQEASGGACWGCAFPNYLNDISYPCQLPGIIDVLHVVAGLIVYAVDSLLCGRPREWNVRQVYLDGGVPDRARLVPPRPGCALCTGYNMWAR